MRLDHLLSKELTEVFRPQNALLVDELVMMDSIAAPSRATPEEFSLQRQPEVGMQESRPGTLFSFEGVR